MRTFINSNTFGALLQWARGLVWIRHRPSKVGGKPSTKESRGSRVRMPVLGNQALHFLAWLENPAESVIFPSFRSYLAHIHVNCILVIELEYFDGEEGLFNRLSFIHIILPANAFQSPQICEMPCRSVSKKDSV